MFDSRLKKASDFGDAVMMGVNTTWGFIKQIYASLNSLVRRRVSANQFVGPIGIGSLAFGLAGVSMYQFILFLGIISVNLAVVNFLPIPVLDGGHMCFLIWEGAARQAGVRGSPRHPHLRRAALHLLADDLRGVPRRQAADLIPSRTAESSALCSCAPTRRVSEGSLANASGWCSDSVRDSAVLLYSGGL